MDDKEKIDDACWIELGTPWHKKNGTRKKLKNLMKCPSWDAQLTDAANNVHDNSEGMKFGGTATMASNYLVSTV